MRLVLIHKVPIPLAFPPHSLYISKQFNQPNYSYMAQYVVHQIGFWYTDECFAVGEEKGTVMGITRSLEEAQAIKKREDLESMKRATGVRPSDFYFDNKNTDEIIEQLTAYYKSEFDLTYNFNDHFCTIPGEL